MGLARRNGEIEIKFKSLVQLMEKIMTKKLKVPVVAAAVTEQIVKAAVQAKVAPKSKAAPKSSRTVRAATPKPEAAKTEKVKPAKEVVAFVGRTLKPGAPFYTIAIGARPGNGSRLKAHTHAALTVFGMLGDDRAAVPRSALLTMMGATAVGYHMKNANLEDAPNNGVRVSSTGLTMFRSRQREGKVDGRVANAFVDLFIDGKNDEAVTLIKPENVYQSKMAA